VQVSIVMHVEDARKDLIERSSGMVLLHGTLLETIKQHASFEVLEGKHEVVLHWLNPAV
jgi:hypothetical protein